MKIYLVKEDYSGEGVSQESIIKAFVTKEKTDAYLDILLEVGKNLKYSYYYVEELEVEE